MNIASIPLPGAVAPALAIAPTGSGQSFAQQFGEGLLSSAAPVGLFGAAVPVAFPSPAATPIVLATEIAGSTVLPLAPLTVPGVEGEASAEAPAPETPPLEPQSDKLVPADTRTAAASDEAITASISRGHPIKTDTVSAGPDKGGLASAVSDSNAVVAPALAEITLEAGAQDTPGSTDKEPVLARDETPAYAIVQAETQPVPEGMTSAAQLPAAISPLVAPVAPSPTASAPTDALAATSTDATPNIATASAVVESATALPGSTIDPAGLARIAPAQPQADCVQATPIGAAAAAPAFAARLAEAYPAATPAQPMPIVEARTGRIGHEMGIEIARRVSAGKEELTVRLNPADMGRVEIRMGFDESGSIRAVVAAESPVALELLRRETADLARALADAGIRSDAQSFRFDSRGGDAGHSGQRPHHGGRRDHEASPPFEGEEAAPIYRPLRTSGRVDLLA